MTWAFIMGPARTSTSVLGYALSLHPECRILHESAFPEHFYNAANGGPPAEIIVRKHNGKHWERDHAFRWWPTEFPCDDGDTPRDACFALRETFPPCDVFGDKLPGAVFYWQRIREMLPESLLIVTQRDRDAIVESQKARASRDPDFAEMFSERGVGYIDRAIAASCRALREPSTIGVAHDDIQGHPAQTIAGVLEFLKLDVADYPFDAMTECFKPGVRVY